MKTRAIFSLILLCVFGFFAKSLTGQANDSLKVANDLYQEGKYEDALLKYQALIDSNYVSVNLYFNTANTYFKLDRLAYAILYYEKAKLLKPNDKDILHNLTYAKSFLDDEIEPIPMPIMKKIWTQIVSFFLPQQWLFLSIGLLLLFAILIYTYFFIRIFLVKKISFFVSISMLLGSVMGFSAANYRNIQINNSELAIVVSPSITLKSEPSLMGTDLFVVHEGLKVFILKVDGNWLHVSLENGEQGWLKESDLERI